MLAFSLSWPTKVNSGWTQAKLITNKLSLWDQQLANVVHLCYSLRVNSSLAFTQNKKTGPKI